MSARDSIESLWDRATPVGPLLDLRSEVLLAAADFLTEIGTPIYGERSEHERGVMYASERLRRMADEAGTATPPEDTPIPLVVSRFDIAMEPAPEEEAVLTIGCIAEDGRPVALLLDPETRRKVGRWISQPVDESPCACGSPWTCDRPLHTADILVKPRARKTGGTP